MSGTHLDPGGNIHKRAHLHISSIVVFLKGRKNVSVGIEACMEIGTAVVQAIEQRDLYRLLYMQDVAVEDEVIWRINNCLDFIAAGNFVRAFERAAQLGPLSDDAFGALIDGVIGRLKGENPVGPQTCRWPPPEEIEAMAAAEVARTRPSSAEELQAAILPLIQPDYLTNPLGGENPSQHPPTGPNGERRAWKASFIDL